MMMNWNVRPRVYLVGQGTTEEYWRPEHFYIGSTARQNVYSCTSVVDIIYTHCCKVFECYLYLNNKSVENHFGEKYLTQGCPTLLWARAA